jgi:drug/metabolite transporter (DMT)-like permease
MAEGNALLGEAEATAATTTDTPTSAKPAADAGAPHPYAVMWGILCVTAAFAIFTFHDALTKWVVADYSPLQVLFVRSVTILTLCCAIGRKRMIVRSARSPIRNTLMLRSIFLLGAWFAFYTAAQRLQLAELTTIYFASPLMVAVLAVPILGETVSRGRWVAILIGFGGVLIACRPDVRAPASAIGLALVAAALWAASMILIRQVALREPTLLQMMTSSFTFVLLTGAALPFTWQTPRLLDLALMAAIGVIGAGAQFLLIEGIKRAPASVVSPLEFTALVWSFVLGYAIWGDVPAVNVFAGAGLILVSGVLIVGSEWKKARAPEAG